MVILAVNVVGNRAGHRHRGGPRRHRQEEAVRDRLFEDGMKRDARVAGDNSSSRIEAEDAAAHATVDQGALVIMAAVAVGAAIAEGQKGAGGRLVPQVFIGVRRDALAGMAVDPPPAVE